MFGLDGLEQIRAFVGGQMLLPPIGRLTGLQPTAAGSGTAEFTLPASGWLAGPAGPIPGGVLTILADGALGCALQTKLGPATPFTTSELSITQLRPVHPRPGLLSASAQVIHRGDAVGLTEAFVIEEGSDRLIAHLTSRLAIFPQHDPVPEPPAERPLLYPPADLDSDPWRRPVQGEVLGQEVWAELSGREVLRRQAAGELPPAPLQMLTGLAPRRAEEGSASFELPASEWLNSPGRRLQGGAIAMIAEAALVGAVQTTAPAGTAIAPLDCKVNFLRPVPGDGRQLTATGRIEHAGRRIAIAGAEVIDEEGNRVALATGSSMYLPGHPADLGEIELGREDSERPD
jgi:uncharacterized protein (TIGR00369 family)